ncbi:MAG: GatB/YqeY domain-containing protein [Chitinophagaceae bacterium]|nr:GatB/YqeY domain-containing protein [Chitinophagaceae bacterium]
MSLELTINEQIKQAMLGKKEADLRGLRAIKSAILLAKTSGTNKDGLTAEDEMKMLQKLVKTRKDSLDIYIQQNREDLAKVEREEIEVIERYLPKQLSEEEIKAVVKDVIAQVDATSAADMGKVMGASTKALAGKADGKLVSAIVKQLLG